jgi:PII-like signaling protein
MEQEVMIVRVYLSEADHGKKKTLLQEIFNLLHDQHRVQGVIVLRGIAGFGDSGEVHASDMLRLNVDLPLVVEFFDTPQVAAAAITLLENIVPAGHIMSWHAVRHQTPSPTAKARSA